MRYQRLDLNLLTALRALLTERNVTRAGEVVHVSQSSMSGMLARLRDYFGDPLIVPVGRRMELTPLAETLVERVNDLMVQLDATLATRPEFDPASSRRTFSIIASDYVCEVLLIDVLRGVHEEAPGVTIEFQQPSSTASLALENGEVDFLISPSTLLPAGQSSAMLFEDTFHAVANRANADVGETLSLEQYLASPQVSFVNQGRAFFETWFAAEHGSAAQIQVVVNTFNMLPHMVAGTKRIATMHSRMAMQAVEQAPLRLVTLGFETPRMVEILQWHSYRDFDPGSQWLRERIIAAAHAMPPI
jgi:LysR family nod box-dependent transcriptional activator